MNSIAERLEQIRGRMSAACTRAGRAPDGVRLVAVAKFFGSEAVREAADAGVRVMGESRVQEARQKIPLCPGSLEWHFIGHLQRNKAREAVTLFQMIHSVDSLRLLETIDAACAEEGARMRVCLEVNVAGESSKFGLAPADVTGVISGAQKLVNVSIVGLMTIPPFTKEPEGARRYFRRLRELRDGWRSASGIGLEHLSMGMSNDFEVAIEEGSTMVRVGTLLFGERPKREEGKSLQDDEGG